MTTRRVVAMLRDPRLPSLAAVVSGLLWALFGIFEMLEPLGPTKIYVPSLGYELVTRPRIFQLYHLPGAVALALLAFALAKLTARQGLAYPGRRVLPFLVLVLALVSLVGTAILLAPMAILGLSMGRLVLGITTMVAGLRAFRSPAKRGLGAILILLGLLGAFLLALQPLTWALMWLPPPLSAAVMVAFGLAWSALGVSLEKQRSRYCLGG